jgi:hypothetical protein
MASLATNAPAQPPVTVSDGQSREIVDTQNRLQEVVGLEVVATQRFLHAQAEFENAARDLARWREEREEVQRAYDATVGWIAKSDVVEQYRSVQVASPKTMVFDGGTAADHPRY